MIKKVCGSVFYVGVIILEDFLIIFYFIGYMIIDLVNSFFWICLFWFKIVVYFYYFVLGVRV